MIYRGTGFIVSNVEFFLIGLHAIFQVPILRQHQRVLHDYRGPGFIVSSVEFFLIGLHAIFQVPVRQDQRVPVLNDL